MFHTFRIRKTHLVSAALLVAVGIAAALYLNKDRILPAQAEPSTSRTINLVTAEFEDTLNGKKIEAYQFYPSTIDVQKGETVTLSIRGINGSSHPFYIEGTNIKGEIQKGKTAKVTFTGEKAGVYRIVCETHHDDKNGGPMVGYINVK